MNYYKNINFYPQDNGVSFETSFSNYDNNWTGCIDFISSGPDNFKLNFQSGKVLDEDGNFICPINLPYAGKSLNNFNIYSGNIFNRNFNLFFNNEKIFSSKTDKNYGAISGVRLYSNNIFWQSNGVRLNIGAKSFPRYSIIFSGSGMYQDKFIPISISGNSANKYPIKINKINLGNSENTPAADVIPYLYVSGAAPSYDQPLVISPGQKYDFNLVKIDPTRNLQGIIPLFLATDFGGYLERLQYQDYLRTVFPQSSRLDVVLNYTPVTITNPSSEFVGSLLLSVYNSTNLFSGITIYVSGGDGNDRCDSNICDSFYPNWRFATITSGNNEGIPGLWLYKNTDIPVITNFASNNYQRFDSDIYSAIYTGGYTGGNQYIPNIEISKNIYVPQFPPFNSLSGFGLLLYNSEVATGANINLKIFEGNNWNSVSGYNTGNNGLITPNTGKLLYSEDFSLELTTGAKYYPVKMTGSLNFSGQKFYSFVFSAYTESGKIYWPKIMNENSSSAGINYFSLIGYTNSGTQISYNTGAVTGSYNSYSGINYNHAFEINPASTKLNTIFSSISGAKNTPSQYFQINIGKILLNSNFTGSAKYLITGHDILFTGTIGLGQDIFRQPYGFYY